MCSGPSLCFLSSGASQWSETCILGMGRELLRRRGGAVCPVSSPISCSLFIQCIKVQPVHPYPSIQVLMTQCQHPSRQVLHRPGIFPQGTTDEKRQEDNVSIDVNFSFRHSSHISSSRDFF